MQTQGQIYLGTSSAGSPVSLLLKMANRHGLIAGATGTGKTVSLRTLAESFSRAGVPVFTADVKGDLAGIACAGELSGKIQERVTQLNIQSFTARGYPTVFWDVFGKSGLQLRATVSDLGPTLFSRLLNLNETQEGVLNAAFKIADDQGMLLLDLKDLRSLLSWMAENAAEFQSEYGNITKATVGAIQRNLLVLEEAGGDQFFGEPALQLSHLMQKDFSGNGVISVLDATTLINNPRIYATMLLWLLAELFEQLPEVGDLEKPKLVFFFDEAHLLFNDVPKALLEKIEQVVRLVRSKGVGIYFVTQNPIDIPDTVAAQLGNRVQHALRAFTAKDQKAVQAAANTFRKNASINTAQVITELVVGEALVSVLDERGAPTPVERVLIAPPESRLGAITEGERKEVVERSPLRGTYEQLVDRESAYELIRKRVEQQKVTAAQKEQEAHEAKGSSSRRQSPIEAFISSTMRAIGSQIGRQIVRGVLGSIMGKK